MTARVGRPSYALLLAAAALLAASGQRLDGANGQLAFSSRTDLV